MIYVNFAWLTQLSTHPFDGFWKKKAFHDTRTKVGRYLSHNMNIENISFKIMFD